MCIFFRSVHSVCLWDEKGAAKVHSALQQDIVDFIKDAQVVCVDISVIINISYCHFSFKCHVQSSFPS